jgi:hypothetical protein
MIELLATLELHRAGIFVAFAMLAGACLLVQWTFWILGRGRFDPRRADLGNGAGARNRPALRYTLTDFMMMLVNDFRHLLALVVVLLFAAMMFFAVWPGLANSDAAQVADGVQTVTAAMGGLLGSIIGYYFGAMAGKKPEPGPSPAPAEEQEDVHTDENAT